MATVAALMLCAAAALVQVGNAIETVYMVPLMGRRDNDSVTSSGEVKYTFVFTNTGNDNIDVQIVGLNNITWIKETITENITVPKNDSKVHTFENDSRSLRGSVYSNQTVMVRSAGYFQLQVFVNDNGYKEGFLGIPQSYLTGGPVEPFNASEYVTSTFCANGGYCQFAVSAFVNDTIVSIKFPHNDVPFNITLCKQKTFINSVDDPAITMGAFDTIQFESTYDLSGVHIYSFQPIAVFVGSRNLTSSFAHTIEQLVPSSYWGKEFVVRSNAVSGYGDIVKLTSSWNKTKVSMTGFAPFVISNRAEVVARRLDNGTLTHIKASHEIQVMKVTGAAYARGNATNVSLTYVPPLEAFANVTKGKCYDGTNAKLHIITQRSGKITGLSAPISTKLVPFTWVYERVYEVGLGDNYSVSMVSPDVMSTDVMTGILQCDTALLPLVMRNNQESLTSPLIQKEVIVEEFGRECREGFHGESVYNETTSIISAHMLNLSATTLGDDILMLRAKVCGEGSLVFHTNSKSVHLLFSKFRMVIFECTQDQCTQPVSTASWFNKKADQCGDDMLMYWFRLINASQLCYGEGVMPDKSKMCNDSNPNPKLESKRYNLSESPTKILMSGLTASAIFNYEFKTLNGCAVYNNTSWRCQDRRHDCSRYGTKFCTENKDFASYWCEKHCGICKVDSFGREFKFEIPVQFIDIKHYVSLYVTPLQSNTHVAVSFVANNDYSNTVNIVNSTVWQGDTHNDGIRYYDSVDVNYGFYCAERPCTIHIYSDKDVAVNVVFRKTGDNTPDYINTPLFPSDLQTTKFIMLSDDKMVRPICRIVSEFKETTMSIKQLKMNYPFTSDTEFCQGPCNNDADISGITVETNRPSLIFCGGYDNYFHFSQLIPIHSMATQFYFPSMPLLASFYNAKLVFLTNNDNTIVNISKGFDAFHLLYNRGNKAVQDIDLSASYNIIASEPIAVGVQFSDHLNRTVFHIVPPTHNFVSGFFASLFRDPDLKMPQPPTVVHSAYHNGSSDTSYKDNTNDKPFYRFWDSKGPAYGFSVVQFNHNTSMIVPGYSAIGPIITPNKAVCETTLSRNDIDSIDNDCDGQIDEETCHPGYGVYPTDHDLDGAFNEDCGAINETGDSIVSAPVPPVCMEPPNRPESQCWTVCKCPCSWVEKYEAEKNLTKTELEEKYKDKNEQMQRTLAVSKENLMNTAMKKKSARDDRKSAASIGYVGIAIFAIVFGTIVILDISALMRDGRMFIMNWRDGIGRLVRCIRRKLCA